MAEINERILDLLRALDTALKQNGASPFTVDESPVALFSNQKQLLRVESDDIIVIGKSFQDILARRNEKETAYSRGSFRDFLGAISKDLVRLNHLGLSYFVEDPAKETDSLKELAKKSEVNLYKESAEIDDEKWLFVGDTDKWNEPLFEFVLSKGSGTDIWRPHFQIDIDTNLSREKLKEIAEVYFGKEFFAWELDVTNVGVVLMMGILENVDGSKIALGVGTNLRDTAWHRSDILRKVT